MLASSYNQILVLCSVAVAILASYSALNMAGRVAHASGKAARLWLAGGAFVMGFGVWSMHFIGMLAFQLPIALGYDLTITGLSLLLAVASSALALHLVSQAELPWSRLIYGGLVMGLGVAGMHYTGMEAMLMTPRIVYDPLILALSVLVAVLASFGALWLGFRLRSQQDASLARAGAAMVMGCAIVGMHYTGMAASRFPLNSICGAANSGIENQWLAVLVIVVTLAVFSIALIVSMLDVRTHKLTSSLDLANDELIKLALHDNLTKLPNRTLLNDRLEQAIRRAERKKTEFSMLFFDLDGFKAVNDMHGHHVGDALLKEIANRLMSAKREEDTIARLGGDEFLMLMESERPENPATVAQRLIALVGQPFSYKGLQLQVTTSVGIAIYPEDGRSAHELMVNADAAMYHVKQQGRNDYQFFEPSMNAAMHQKMQLKRDLRQAIQRREFVLHYQPKFSVIDNEMAGMEALLRWQHPQDGLLAPDRFLPAAESSGLIVEIGYLVIEEACRQMKRWCEQGHCELTMAVNLSTVQLEQGDLVERVKAALEHNELAPSRLMLEITETTAMTDAERSLQVLDQLAALGVSISIDDFGTGYSSLMYLKRFPARELKIDRGFVRELTRGSSDEAIVRAVIALGKTLNMKIVAEGVETAEQKQLLEELGCHFLQGYLLGRPVAPDALDIQLHGRLIPS
ncbi:putative bifunctional diguanylate cyclase/phosphodiesterase [Oceanimonas smirnovii]|uniref:putative bifunctional diguanylate cyclase/phosphodiesterase n=1 Tax=Oceanimonas smirnovii TaxID=264574 RepID=UPI0037706DAF